MSNFAGANSNKDDSPLEIRNNEEEIWYKKFINAKQQCREKFGNKHRSNSRPNSPQYDHNVSTAKFHTFVNDFNELNSILNNIYKISINNYEILYKKFEQTDNQCKNKWKNDNKNINPISRMIRIINNFNTFNSLIKQFETNLHFNLNDLKNKLILLKNSINYSNNNNNNNNNNIDIESLNYKFSQLLKQNSYKTDDVKLKTL